ncbi:MAG: hypothetical protein OEV55_03910 [candidate division Zixibacteria bacterium]|nr:hypothetical protein [candidate division Zixibacteria bacterium]
MCNKKIFSVGLIILAITLGAFWVLPGLIFPDDQGKYTRPYIPGSNTTREIEPPKQEIKQIFDYGFESPVDSCKGGAFLAQISFESLPQLNKPTKIYVKLKSCWETTKEVPHFDVRGNEGSLDYTQLEPKLLPPIKKGDEYEGEVTIIPRDIGKYLLHIFMVKGGVDVKFGFNESGELVHLSNKGFFPKTELHNHPIISDTEIYVKFGGTYVTNLFHITPPLSLHDTSIVNYRVVTKVDYPDGLKIVTNYGRNISFEMVPGPVNKGDTLRGSFIAVPPRVGKNSIGLGIEEPPREGVKPQNDSFSAQYHLLPDGKILFISKGQKQYGSLVSYYRKKGVSLE